MTPPRGAENILTERKELDFVAETLAGRAADHAPMAQAEADALRRTVRDRVVDLLDEWSGIADAYAKVALGLQYQREAGGAQRLLYEFLNPELKKLPPRHRKFRATRSMRDVEPSVHLWLKTLDDREVPAAEEAAA